MGHRRQEGRDVNERASENERERESRRVIASIGKLNVGSGNR
jgi:hypothetical protein